MDIINLVENMSEDMYLRLKCAAETGKWPEGQEVDEAQRESALQIVFAYQAKRMNNDEMLTIGPDGHVINKTKSQLKKEFSQQEQIAKFRDL